MLAIQIAKDGSRLGPNTLLVKLGLHVRISVTVQAQSRILEEGSQEHIPMEAPARPRGEHYFVTAGMYTQPNKLWFLLLPEVMKFRNMNEGERGPNRSPELSSS